MKSATPSPTAAPANPVLNFLRGWNEFWFNPANPTGLGLIRILAGAVTLYAHLAYTVDLQELFSRDAWIDQQAMTEIRRDFPWRCRSTSWDENLTVPLSEAAEDKAYEKAYMKSWYYVNPRTTVAKGYPTWSIWYHVTDAKWIEVVHVGILVCMFLFTIGFCTRVTAVLTWLGAVSYIQRAQTTVFGMDTMMNLLLIYLMIGPSGAALSVDRLIARFWASRRSLRDRKPLGRFRPVPLVSANFALRLIQINLCIIYLASGLSKMQGQSWWSANAIWYTMANYEFAPFQFDLYRMGVRWLCEHRIIWEAFITGGVAFTLFVEIGFPFLVWNRKLRWTMVCGALILHTGIAAIMRLNTFSLLMMTMLLSFVPDETLQWFFQLPARGAARFRLAFNREDRGQVRVASIIHAVDAWNQVDIQEPQEDGLARHRGDGGKHATQRAGGAEPDHLELVTDAGEVLKGPALLRRLLVSLRLLWPLAPLALVLSLFDHRAETSLTVTH